MSFNNTPSSLKLHIGILGKTNVGKSSLINKITNQPISIVSQISGTTTDVVYKSMEIIGLGPVVFLDTAGYDDKSNLSNERLKQTKLAINKMDLALFLFTNEIDEEDLIWTKYLLANNKKIIPIINKTDILSKEKIENIKKSIFKELKITPILISCIQKDTTLELFEVIKSVKQDNFTEKTLTSNLCSQGDCVLLVMPQDIQAPKGRLILPQVQTIRELLDKKCVIHCCTTDTFITTLNTLKNNPKLIITDSQVFKFVYENKPKDSLLTSFSILQAAQKGNIKDFIEATNYINKLNNNSKILIAEACTHAPATEDIGKIKIPNMLKKLYPNIKIDFVSGCDFPEKFNKSNDTDYDLIIHCGCCMFNSQFMLARQKKSKEAKIPMTNYGIFIAYINNILDKVCIP